MSNIDFAYIAGMCCLGCTLYCFKDAFKLPFGGNYVIGILFYFVASITYFLIHSVNSTKTILELISLGLAFSLLPLLFIGISKKCFLWIKLSIAVLFLVLTSWAIISNHSLFILSIPMLVGFFLFYAIDGLGIDNKEENEEPEEDLLYRTDEYDRLFKEIRQLAGAQDASGSIKGVNLALCSPWGSGKSHFLTHLRKALSKKAERSSGWEDVFEVRSIDLWKMQKVEELWEAVNSAIMRAVMGEEKAYIYAAESTLLRTILQIPSDAESAKNIYKLVYNRKDDYSLSGVNEKLKDKRVLLVFEDLERADSKILVSLLPLLDRIRKIDNLITICAIDKDELQRKLNREDVDFESYMTKVFDRRIYLPPIRKDGIEKMQKHLLSTRYNSSVLMREFFSSFPHHFDTPRKLIRVCDALESIEHLYFGRLSAIRHFSFKGCEYSECLFRLFVICEVEVLRTCEPALLDKIATESDIVSFLNKLPEDAMSGVLSSKQANQVISFDSLPSNVDLYRKVDEELYSAYARIKEVIMQNDCALFAFANLYKFRKHESLDLCFMYAVYRQYMLDADFIERLAKELNPVEKNDGTMERNNYTDSILPMPELTQRIYETMGPPFSNDKQQKDLGYLLKDTKVLDALKEYNKGYPFSDHVVTNLYSHRFVKFVLEVFENTKLLPENRNRLEELLCELYKTMFVGEQAHVLTPAFYLKNASEVKGGLDGRYQQLVKNHPELNDFLKKLCSIYAEQVYAYAMNPRLYLGALVGKEPLTDYKLQAYKNVKDDSIYKAFIDGLYAASDKNEASLSESLDSFVRFMGVKYDSANFISDEYSTYATPEVAGFMWNIYTTIEKKHINSSLKLSQKESLLRTYHSTKDILEKDYQSWLVVPDTMSSKNAYLQGISTLLDLLEEIKNKYIKTL